MPGMALAEAEDIVGQAMEKLSSLESELQTFAAENSALFVNGAERLAQSGGECPLEWHTCYESYCKQYDDALETFLADASLSQEQFADAARTVMSDDEASGRTRFFLEALIASTDFGMFKTLMISEAMSAPPSGHK